MGKVARTPLRPRWPERAGGPGPPGRRVGGLLCQPRSLFSRPGRLGSWTHPPLDSIQEGGCCFFPLDFLEFWKPSGPGGGEGGRSRSGEECESLPRPGGARRSWEPQLPGFWNRDFRVILFCFRTLFQWKVGFLPSHFSKSLDFSPGSGRRENSLQGLPRVGKKTMDMRLPCPQGAGSCDREVLEPWAQL